MSNKAIVNLGELSRPATVLVEKISAAIGGLFKPHQIVRVAKAESEAERIKAEGQIQISDIQRRAFHRFLTEEAAKQKNIEDITQKALPHLLDQSTPEQMEDDWITNFFDRSRLISDKEMQTLWSRVLAGEANSPGSFSKRTVNFLSDLDKADAEVFTRLCGFGWMLGDIVPLVFDVQNKMYTSHGITFATLSHLESIGLIHFNNLSGFVRPELPQNFRVAYYGTPVELERPSESSNLELGKVLLTKVGQQLAVICGSRPVEGFSEYVLERWRITGYLKGSASQGTQV